MQLTGTELQEALADLPGWTGDTTGITREFTFDTYEAGVAFAVHVALMAQQADHHPDALSIGWKKVAVTYVTHSSSGVTELDVRAAHAVSSVYGPT